MENRFKRIRVFLSIAIPFFILALPAYLRCAQLSQSKFVSSDLTIESQGQEEGLSDSEKELKVCGSNAFLTIFALGIDLFEQSFHLFSQTFSLHQEMFVLRC